MLPPRNDGGEIVIAKQTAAFQTTHGIKTASAASPRNKLPHFPHVPFAELFFSRLRRKTFYCQNAIFNSYYCFYKFFILKNRIIIKIVL
jgi:hypothetical protein